jgi:hypothetical protein
LWNYYQGISYISDVHPHFAFSYIGYTPDLSGISLWEKELGTGYSILWSEIPMCQIKNIKNIKKIKELPQGQEHVVRY